MTHMRKPSSFNLQLHTFLSVSCTWRHGFCCSQSQSTVHHRAERQSNRWHSHARTPTTNSEALISPTCTVLGPWEEEASRADRALLCNLSLFYTVGSRMVMMMMMMFTSTVCYICKCGKLINVQCALRAQPPRCNHCSTYTFHNNMTIIYLISLCF